VLEDLKFWLNNCMAYRIVWLGWNLRKLF